MGRIGVWDQRFVSSPLVSMDWEICDPGQVIHTLKTNPSQILQLALFRISSLCFVRWMNHHRVTKTVSFLRSPRSSCLEHMFTWMVVIENGVSLSQGCYIFKACLVLKNISRFLYQRGREGIFRCIIFLCVIISCETFGCFIIPVV